MLLSPFKFRSKFEAKGQTNQLEDRLFQTINTTTLFTTHYTLLVTLNRSTTINTRVLQNDVISVHNRLLIASRSSGLNWSNAAATACADSGGAAAAGPAGAAAAAAAGLVDFSIAVASRRMLAALSF
jgi:hypothetical protein